jgi:hypothetical protein
MSRRLITIQDGGKLSSVSYGGLRTPRICWLLGFRQEFVELKDIRTTLNNLYMKTFSQTIPLKTSSKYIMASYADIEDGSEAETQHFLDSEKLEMSMSDQSRRPWTNRGVSVVKFLILVLLTIMSTAFVILVIQDRSLLKNLADPAKALGSVHTVDVLDGNPHHHTPLIQPCGNTTEQARAAGCHFDIISFSWFPSRCYDAALAEEFDQLQTWRWYRDLERKEEVPRQEALSGVNPVLYVDWGYHIIHCTYMWRKMHRAIAGPHGLAAIDSYIGKLPHTEHCGQMLLSNREVALETMNTGIRVKYPDCGVIEGGSGGYDYAGAHHDGGHHHS